MQVEVRVFATLRQYLPDLGIGEAKVMDVPEGTTFAQLRDMLGLPADEVKIIMRNGIHVEPDDVVQDGDRIAFIPAVAGG
ncbi:MAG: MoaD/ThiS family protein [Chloroflexi bacterium]|nr:MoaD/ThiS family protein [Chloroflexota bacterium]